MANRISAIVLTKNEASCIERCIRGALRWADEVLVLDCESTDATREIAVSLGARVEVQPWLGWVAQRQHGISLATNDWVFCLEADEMADDELAAAIVQAMTREPDPFDGFNVVRRDEFFGCLLPNLRNSSRQKAFFRLFNRKYSAYAADHLIHEEVRVPGRSIPLSGVLIHWRNATLTEQMSRYVIYLELQARQDEMAGRRANVVRLLLMPVLRFFWVYIARGVWRLGTTGLVVSIQMACADFLRWAALWEKQCVHHIPDPPAALLKGRSTPDANLQ